MHPACAGKFFGTTSVPVLDYTTEQLDELAQQVIQSQTSLTGVQPKLSLHIKDHEGSKLALTLNGRKKRLTREDFVKAAASVGIKSVTVDRLIKKFTKLHPTLIHAIDESMLTEELKEKYKEVIRLRLKQLKVVVDYD